MNAPAIPRTYAALRREVENVVVRGRSQIERAWVRTYHETGRLIVEHLLLHQDRAGYGATVFARLADETKISRRVLYECVQFYRCFPIVRAPAQLGWQQYRLLCQVADATRREALAVDAAKQHWTSGELAARVRALNAAAESPADGAGTASPPVKLLRPRCGTPHVYRVVARDGGLAVDVGFKLYRALAPSEARGVAAGALVRLTGDGFAPAPDLSAADLFTYRATARRVVDGDTLLVTIALPDYVMDEKLRLRGLDCPELDTDEGKAAKRFAETLLLDAPEVIVTTSKVDKYDRYLADVFVPPKPRAESPELRERSDPRLLAASERSEDAASVNSQPAAGGGFVFLNNELLKHGHAQPMGHEALDDWVP